MGASGSSIKSYDISASKVVAEAYLYVTQNIAQGVNNNQIVAINCSDNKTNTLCVNCIQSVSNLGKEGKETKEEIDKLVQQLCITPCNCDISKVDLSQKVSVDFEAFLQADSKNLFKSSIQNSIYNQAYQQQGNLSFDEKEDTISKIGDELYTNITSSTVQNTLQGLKNLQVIKLNSPGNIVNVDMNQAIDFISKVFENSTQTSTIISQLETEIINAATQISEAGINQLIIIIILLLMIVFSIVIFGFAFNLLIELYTLYVG